MRLDLEIFRFRRRVSALNANNQYWISRQCTYTRVSSINARCSSVYYYMHAWRYTIINNLNDQYQQTTRIHKFGRRCADMLCTRIIPGVKRIICFWNKPLIIRAHNMRIFYTIIRHNNFAARRESTGFDGKTNDNNSNFNDYLCIGLKNSFFFF